VKIVGPLLRGATYRRGVYLLLGGVLALPYALLAVLFVSTWAEPSVPRLTLTLMLLGTVLIGLVPAFLRGTRALEIAAVRWLLDVDLPDPLPGAVAEGRDTRLRGALWFALHLAIGGLVTFALPAAVAVLTPPVLPVVIVGLVYAVAGLGALASVMAPVLLGPSATERIAALEAHATKLAERNRLARELHDSVGHALTVTTLQAAAARELLERDPAFVRRALSAIEETGRAAMDDLDHVLGVLRESEQAKEPHRTLGQLDRLLADTRATGVPVEARIEGTTSTLPAATSREGYRIVQESLTNAMRHAGKVPVTVHIGVSPDALAIEVTNPLPHKVSTRPGRGLNGMRERVTLLGGTLAVGPVDGLWRVTASLPLKP